MFSGADIEICAEEPYFLLGLRYLEIDLRKVLIALPVPLDESGVL